MTKRISPTKRRHAGFDRTPRIGDLEQINKVLGPLWQRIGREPHYPIDDDELLGLARAGEYVGGLDTLELFIRRQYVHPRIDKRGRRQWSGADCLIALLHLERLRLWRPAPSVHDSKKSRGRFLIEWAKAEGRLAEFIAPAAEWATEDLLLQIVESDDREKRETFFELLRARGDLED